MDEWIDILEQEPPQGITVLMCDSVCGFVTLGKIIDKWKVELTVLEENDATEIERDAVITHWMYKPKAPIY